MILLSRDVGQNKMYYLVSPDGTKVWSRLNNTRFWVKCCPGPRLITLLSKCKLVGVNFKFKRN